MRSGDQSCSHTDSRSPFRLPHLARRAQTPSIARNGCGIYILNPEFLESVASPCFDAKIRRLVNLWKLKAKIAGGSTFAALADLRRTTREVLWRLLLGYKLELTDASICHLQENMNADIAGISSPKSPDFFRAFKLVHDNY
jgi:hypothetical protein